MIGECPTIGTACLPWLRSQAPVSSLPTYVADCSPQRTLWQPRLTSSCTQACPSASPLPVFFSVLHHLSPVVSLSSPLFSLGAFLGPRRVGVLRPPSFSLFCVCIFLSFSLPFTLKGEALSAPVCACEFFLPFFTPSRPFLVRPHSGAPPSSPCRLWLALAFIPRLSFPSLLA